MSYDRYQKTLARMYSAISDDDDNIIYNLVGTGFLIAEQYLLTCAHVIASALGIDGKTYEIPQGVVFLDFPFLDFESDSKKNKKFRARVAYWLPEDPHCNQVEDIAGLYLLEPLSYKLEPARMKSIEDFHSLEILKRHHLRIFGFPEVPGKEAYAVPASAPLANRWIQIQDTYETGPSLKEGFSGSPVWDEQLQGIVGMVLAKDTEPNRKIAYMIPRRDLPAFENVSLYQLLQKLSEFEHEIYSDLYEIYQEYQPGIRVFPKPITLWEILRNLEDALDSSRVQVNLIMKFIAALSIRLSNREKPRLDIVKSLQNWVEEQGEDLNQLQAYVKAKATNKRSSFLDSNLSNSQEAECSKQSYLMVVVQANPHEPDSNLTVNAWIIPDSNTYDAETEEGMQRLSLQKELRVNRPKLSNLDEQQEFAKQMSHYLHSFLIQSGSGHKNLIIEVFLPLELLTHPADTWSFLVYGISQSIGSTYPLVLRSSERLAPNYNMFLDKWKEKWDVFSSTTKTTSCSQILMPTPLDADIHQIMSIAENAIGIHLPNGIQAGEGGPLAAILAKGVPVAFWLRRCFLCRPNYRQELYAVMEGPIYQLPQNVKNARNQAYAKSWPVLHTDEDPIGHHLALLWEDFNRLPPFVP